MSFMNHTPPPFDYSCRCEVEDDTALSILQLRLLIRNDEARIEHLTAWANHIGEGDFRPTDLAEWIEAAHLKLAHHRARLEGLLILRDCAAPIPPAVSQQVSPAFALGK